MMKNSGWQNLTKKERRALKKEEQMMAKEQEQRKNSLLKWGIIFGVAVILVSGFFVFQYLNKKTYEEAPKIQITPAIYDFGKIKAEKGNVETSFEVKNSGSSPLVITGMETSCDCTTAKLRVDDKESPVFGMHSGPSGWSTSLEPGKTAQAIVIFDPNFHQDASGPITRAVTIFSNDPKKSKEVVTVYADVQR